MDPKNYNFPYGLRHRKTRGFEKKQKLTKADIFKESLRTVSKEYCSESSIGGLKHLVNANTSPIERIIWIITMICALICSVTLVWITFKKFYEAPLVTTQMPEGVSVSEIIFPAVGICTNNRISKRAVTQLAHKLLEEERNKKYSESDMMSLLFGLGHLYNMHSTDDRVVNPLHLHEVLGDYNVIELMKNLTPKCEDLLLQCSWNEEPKKCTELFDFRLSMNGYCCTFNYLRPSDMFQEEKNISRTLELFNNGNKSTFDFDQGLKVLMSLNEIDDFYYNIPLQGAELQFTDPFDFPDAPSGSFGMQIISQSVQMTVMVTASNTEASRDIQHIPVNLRGCLFYDESPDLSFYTASDCILKCRVQFLQDNCNCTPFNMPKMKNAKTCDLSDVSCIRLYYVQSISVRPNVEPVPKELELDIVRGGIHCPMCYPTCSKTTYKYDFIDVNIYPKELNAVSDSDRPIWLKQKQRASMPAGIVTAVEVVMALNKPSYIWTSIYKMRGANYTGTSIVHVKYARESAVSYGQNVIMKWFDLISNIGSTCGFVTGFSFVSILEIFYFFTVKLIREMRTRHQKQNVNVNTAVQSTPAQCKSKHRPIYWNEIAVSTGFGNENFFSE